jgi:hypothetical protein
MQQAILATDRRNLTAGSDGHGLEFTIRIVKVVPVFQPIRAPDSCASVVPDAD